MANRRYFEVWLAPLSLVALVVLAYSNSFSCAFLFDDMSRIVSNPAIRRFSSSLFGTARPLTTLTLYLNYKTGGYNPADYHLTNLAIHSGAALLLYGLLRTTLLFLPARSSRRTADHVLAFLIAAVWALHPLQTECVTYLIQRAESLMGFFYLATVFAFARAHRSQSPSRWLMISIVACALGMATKPVMATAPLMVLLYDWTFVARPQNEGIRARKVFYALLASTWLIPVCLLAATRDSLDSAGFGTTMLSPMRYFLTQAGVVVHYLQLVFWPRSLCIDYGWPPTATFLDSVPPLVFMGCLGGVTLLLWRYARAVAFAMTWFFVTLLPTSSVIPIADCAAEHRMYLPLAGVVTTVGILVFSLLDLLFKRRDGKHIYAWVLLAVVLAPLARRTYVRNRDYRTERTMWRSVVEAYPSNDRAVLNLSRALIKEGEGEQSIELCRGLIRKHDYFRELSRDQIEAKCTGDGALDFLFDRIRYATAHQHIGLSLMGDDRFSEAEAHFLEACRVTPGDVGYRHDLALLRIRQNQFDAALNLWQEVLACDARNSRAHTWVGLLLLRRGNEEAARRHFEAALRTNPDIVPAKHMLVWILAASSSPELRDGARAVRLGESLNEMTGGRNVGVLEALAAAYAEQGEFDRAEAIVTEALEIATSSPHPDPVVIEALEGRRLRCRQRLPLRSGRPEITAALLNNLI